MEIRLGGERWGEGGGDDDDGYMGEREKMKLGKWGDQLAAKNVGRSIEGRKLYYSLFFLLAFIFLLGKLLKLPFLFRWKK